jgi:ABC-2 type transport system ATP-binding protein
MKEEMKLDTVLVAEDLCYHFRHQWTMRAIPILKSVSFSVKSGETFGFLGRNGSGKTTTIKCLLGLITPSSGKLQVLGRSYKDAKARARIGYVPEQPYFYDNLSVFEIMKLYATLSGVSGANRDRYIADALKRLDIYDRKNAKMRSLSKGLSQRVALAQAIVGMPRLLILDEPFSGLDPVGRREFRDIFFELKSKGVTLFICTHVLADVEHLCDRALILNKGEVQGIYDLKKVLVNDSEQFEVTIQAEGQDLSDLKNSAKSSKSEGPLHHFIVPNRAEAEKFVGRVLSKGYPLVQYKAHHRSLEELFVENTQPGS